MKREFLEGLNLDKETVDKIMAENGSDLEREKAKTTQAKADLADAQAQLAQRDKDLEELKKTTGDADALKKQLEELQGKYTTETEQYKAQLAERDYLDAMTAAIAGKGLKFSSKSAERAFRDDLKAKGLTIKDGTLEGFEDYVKAQMEADPSAFAPDKPPAAIVKPVGTGGASATEPENVRLAKQMGERKAAAREASNDILKNYL